MKIIHTPQEMQTVSRSLQRAGRSIGFVPTMGYLHEGHLSLARASKAQCDETVASIFVNPTQFGPKEDLDRYPRDFERDVQLLESIGVDWLFAPTRESLYPEGFSTTVSVEQVTQRLCGASRPWHFPGVALVVCKLFNIVRPDKAFFGQKDYQQCLVIKRMTPDLDFGIEIGILPTVRESDGLAMSSRNKYLSPEDRAKATVLIQALKNANHLYLEGERSVEKLTLALKKTLETVPEARVDYAEILDADKLTPIESADGPAVAALAVFFGQTRLIDNHILGNTISF